MHHASAFIAYTVEPGIIIGCLVYQGLFQVSLCTKGYSGPETSVDFAFSLNRFHHIRSSVSIFIVISRSYDYMRACDRYCANGTYHN